MDKTTDEYHTIISGCKKIFVNPDTWQADKMIHMECTNCQRKSKYRPRDFVRQLAKTDGVCPCLNRGKSEVKPKIEKPKKVRESKKIEIKSLPVEQQYDLEKYYNNGELYIGKEDFNHLRGFIQGEDKNTDEVKQKVDKFAHSLITICEKYFNDYPMTNPYKEEDIRRNHYLLTIDKTEIKDNVIQANTNGRVLCNVIMNDLMIRARAVDSPSYYDAWMDKGKRFKILRRVILMDEFFNNNRAYQAFGCRWQKLYNFPPNVARVLYNKYADGGRVLDFCAGWGGRMHGFACSNAKEYVGIDVNDKVPYGELIKKLREYGIEKDIEVYNSPAEDFDYSQIGMFDFVFTSPPYFNTEIYSEDEKQSCHRYKQIDSWLENFLFKTLGKVSGVIKSGGHLAINIKDSGKNAIVQPMIDWLENIGWKEVDRYTLGQAKRHRNNTKYEYIHIFKNINDLN